MKKAGEKRKVPLYWKERGKLPYRLTNDYLFRALLQENNQVLKYIVCAMKHLRPEEVKSVIILNPILLGMAIDDRTYILDVQVEMNKGDIINFEMQTYTMVGWEERSLLYLCRAFDSLHQGEKYGSAKPVTHVGFLDYTLFPEAPEFYATYKMINIKNFHLYTDKFTLSVVDLSRIDLATEEDKKWHIDILASLFKATTWEEIKMLAERDEIIEEAADTVYKLTRDRVIQQQCRAREDYDRQMRYYERKMKELAGKDATLDQMEEKIAEKDAALNRMEKKITDKDAALNQMEKKITDKDAALNRMEGELAGKDATLDQMEEKIAEKDAALNRMEKKITDKDAEIIRLKKLLAEKN